MPRSVREWYLRGYETFDDCEARLPRVSEEIYNAKRLRAALGYQ